jgi:hypothetical protein
MRSPGSSTKTGCARSEYVAIANAVGSGAGG